MAYQSLFLKVIFQSKGPTLDPSSIGLSYFALGGTPLLTDVQSLVTGIITSLGAVAPGATHNPMNSLSATVAVSSTSGTVEAYDISTHLNGTPHGAPVLVQQFTPAPGTGTQPMPEGVCAVITLQAPYGSDVEFAPSARPRARDRGRIYWGPLNGNCLGFEATTQRSVITSTYATDLIKWIKSINNVNATGAISFQLGVWSRKNAIIKPLSQCWVDDRPDYQRRRTDQSAVRYSQTLP